MRIYLRVYVTFPFVKSRVSNVQNVFDCQGQKLTHFLGSQTVVEITTTVVRFMRFHWVFIKIVDKWSVILEKF